MSSNCKNKTSKKWAIMVPFEEDWLYVVDVNNGVDGIFPLLYNTRKAAEAVAETFQTYRVVEYES